MSIKIALTDHLLTSGAAQADARWIVLALVVLTALLGGFLFIMALTVVFRRKGRRESHQSKPNVKSQQDPWKEAAHRIKP